MVKSVLLIETGGLAKEVVKKGNKVSYVSKGHITNREDFYIDDARKYIKHDIIIIEATEERAENLRKLMKEAQENFIKTEKEQLKRDTEPKDIVICRCGWYGYWCDKGGIYQLTTLDKSFKEAEKHESNCPAIEGMHAAFKKHSELTKPKTLVKTNMI
jgi:hypothetical protein